MWKQSVGPIKSLEDGESKDRHHGSDHSHQVQNREDRHGLNFGNGEKPCDAAKRCKKTIQNSRKTQE